MQAVVSRNADLRIQHEAEVLPCPFTFFRHPRPPIFEAHRFGARRTKYQRPGDGRPRHPSQRGAFLGYGVLVLVRVLEPDVATFKERQHRLGDARHHAVQVVQRRWRKIKENRISGGIQDIHAIENEGVVVDVQVQRRTETLHGHHRARVGLARRDEAQGAPCAEALEAEDLLHRRA